MPTLPYRSPSVRHRPFVIGALLVACASAAGAQEAVLLRLGGVVGQPVHSRVVMVSYMAGPSLQAMGVDSTVPTMRFTMHLTQTLVAIAGDTLRFTTVLDSMRAESPAIPALVIPVDSAKAAASRHTRLTMDRRGRVLSVDSGRSGATDAPPSPPPVGSLAPGIGLGDAGVMLPEHAVRVGESWGDSVPEPIETAGPTPLRRRTYRLDRIEPRGDSGTAVITMARTFTVPPLDGPPRQGVVAGILRFDIAARRVTAYALTSMFVALTPAGDVTTRLEITSDEPGGTPPAQPMIRRSRPPAPPR